MRIQIVTPAKAGSTHGNRITAVRWGSIFKQLGHRVSITQTYDGKDSDLLVALHARRSYESIRRFHLKHPATPIIVALTGTDVYRESACAIDLPHAGRRDEGISPHLP